MQGIYHRTRKLAAWLVLILPGMVTLGCDSPPPLNPEVSTEAKIRRLVDDVDDFAKTPKELAVIPRLFAPDCKHSKEALPRYADFHYEVKRIVQSGDSATVTVVVKDAKTGDPAGELQWSMTNVDGRLWRIKDAPLPTGRGS